MATTRTLKHGDIFIYEDGSVRPVWSETGVTYPTAFLDSSEGAVYLAVDGSGDIIRKTGGDLLAIDSPTSAASVVHSETNTIISPVVWQDGSNTHMWFGYDVSGTSIYLTYYNVSTDGGATWGTSSLCIAAGGGGSWNDSGIWPIGVYKNTTTSKYVLICMGYDGANYKIGQWTIDTGDDLTNSVNYDAYGSNPVFPSSTTMSQYATACYGEGYYHLYAQGSSATQIVYARSADGITWDQADDAYMNVILQSGPSGTSDDAYVRPSGSIYAKNNYWLFYWGQDGTNSRAFNAMGPQPDALYKIGNVGYQPSGTSSRVYYCTGDLTIGQGPLAIHVMDRGGAGCAIDAMHESFPFSFTFYQQGIGTSGSGGASDSTELFADMFLTNPSVNYPQATNAVKQCHVLYRIDDDSGSPEAFYLLPRCVLTGSIEEGAEGNMVTIDGMCSGDRRPYVGNY